MTVDILNKISAPNPQLLKTNFNNCVSLATPTLGVAGNYTVSVTNINDIDANSGYNVQNSFKSYLGTQTIFMIQALPGAPVTDGDVTRATAPYYNRVAGVRIWDNVPAQYAYQ